MNFMERKFVYVLCLVFIMNFGFCLEDDWGNISTGDNAEVLVENVSEVVGSEFEDVEPVSYVDDEIVSGDGTYFTAEFYVAMGLVLLFLLVLGFFAWLWLKGPKNKWEK